MGVVLVIGGAGFIGSHVVDALVARGHEVVVLDDLSGGFEENVPPGVAFVKGSITDVGLVENMFAQYRFGHVFHLAAYAAEGLSHFIRRFNYTNNLIGSVNLVNAAVNHGVKCFVFTSSIAVYGSSPQLPMTEETAPHPEDPYGIAKLSVEQDLRASKEMFGLDYIVFRPHNVYGERQNIGDRYRNVVGIFMNQLLMGRPMTIFGDGSQTRAFSYIDDVAPLIAESIDVPAARNEVFNVGADVPVSVNDLAVAVARVMGLSPNVVHLPARNEVVNAYSSHDKVRRIFGERRPFDLERGLERIGRVGAPAGSATLPALRADRGPQEPTRGMDKVSQSQAPLVVCVVLNMNRREDTLECLGSLYRGTYRHFRAVVLDCQSSDGSVDAVRAAFPDAHVVSLTENRGYAGNNNVGIDLALREGADWVFVLNEDTVLAPDCLERLVTVGESEPVVGVVGPMVYHHDEPTVIQSAGGRFTATWNAYHLGQNETDVGQFREPHQVEWISGCGILVRRAVIDQIGAIDERYFIYWEETEWCVRAGKAGWRLVHVPGARMWHKGVQRDYRPKPSVTYYSTRNRLLTLSTHGAPVTAWAVAYAQLARTLASWSVRPKWRAKRAHRDAMWHGIVDFLRRRWGQMPAR